MPFVPVSTGSMRLFVVNPITTERNPMPSNEITQAVTGGETPSVDLAGQIGKAALRLEEIADEMKTAKDEDGVRYAELKAEQTVHAQELSALKAKAEAEEKENEYKATVEAAAEWKQFAANFRNPSKAGVIAGGGPSPKKGYQRGDFLFAVHEANARDAERQAAGKALLSELNKQAPAMGFEGKAAFTYEDSWGKATLGTTDATGGWVIPNAIVDEFITPAAVTNIYRQLMTVIPGVTAAAVDIPFRSAARSAAAVVAAGQTKENLDLAYNGYTATMYTIARIYDVANQFLRQSRGAAEADVLSELAAAFAQGESNYIREGTGSSQPFGYTPALTNGPGTFRSTFSSPSDSTVGLDRIGHRHRSRRARRSWSRSDRRRPLGDGVLEHAPAGLRHGGLLVRHAGAQPREHSSGHPHQPVRHPGLRRCRSGPPGHSSGHRQPCRGRLEEVQGVLRPELPRRLLGRGRYSLGHQPHRLPR